MTTQQINTVKHTWNIISALDPVTVGNLFYTRLFSIAPEVKPMFRSSMEEQSKKPRITDLNFGYCDENVVVFKI